MQQGMQTDTTFQHCWEHPQRPRGGQFGQKKRRRKFSRAGKGAPEMLLFKSQIYDSFRCLSVIGHKKVGNQSKQVNSFV